MHVQYYTLNESDGGSQVIDPKEWQKIISRNLLSTDEIERIKAYVGYKPFLPLIWAMHEIEDTLFVDQPSATDMEKLAKFNRDSEISASFREGTCTLHAHCMHTACTLHAHCMHTACTLHAHCMHTHAQAPRVCVYPCACTQDMGL